VLHCVTEWCCELQCSAVCCNELQYVVVCCSMSQCVAVCCSAARTMCVCVCVCVRVRVQEVLQIDKLLYTAARTMCAARMCSAGTNTHLYV